MTRVEWDPEERTMRSGVDHGVLYPKNAPAVVWNGLTDVNEIPSDSIVSASYLDGQKYVVNQTAGEFAATIEAFTYPNELDAINLFDFSYRIQKDSGYEIHIVYNATQVPNDSSASSINANTDPRTFSFNIFTTPVKSPHVRPFAHLIIDTTNAQPGILASVEDILYGSATTDPRTLSLEELLSIFEAGALFRIIDNGNGTWTAIGPDDWITMLDDHTFQITTPSAIFLDDHTYQISSW